MAWLHRRRFEHRGWYGALAALAWTLTVLAPPPAGAQGLLLPPPPAPAPPPPVDPSLPRGFPRAESSRPADQGLRACSFTAPVCVEPRTLGLVPAASRALRALELAYTRLVDALDLPAPRLPLPGNGSGLLALVEPPDAQPAVEVVPEDFGLGVFDTSSAVCHLRAARGIALERASTLCVGEAIALRLDPGMSPHLRRAYATYLWWLTGALTSGDVEALASFQRAPHQAVLGGELGRTSEGAGLFFDYFEGLSAGLKTGATSTALLARAGSSTPPEAVEWHNEPDVVDVLMSSFEGTPLPWPLLLGGFARARGLLGVRALSPPDSPFAITSTSLEVSFDWRLAASTLPRRVLVTGIEPTGSAFLWLDVDEPFAPDEALAVSASCEGPSPFVWEVVKLQKDEPRPIVVPLAFQERSETVERTVSELQATRAVLIAGTSVGGLGRSFPFDPDVWPYEAHACTVSVARLSHAGFQVPLPAARRSDRGPRRSAPRNTPR